MATRIPLTALEASFLAIERPGLPMHVAGVLIVDSASGAGGPLTLKDLRRLVASRISRLPTFKRRVSFGLLGLSRPVWVETKELDIDAHLFEHRLRAPGRTSQLVALCAKIHTVPLSRERPLWEIHLIDGLADARQVVVIKAHHAITDGIAGMQVAEVLFDRARPNRKSADARRPAPRFARAMLPTAIDLAQALLGAAFTVAGGPIATPGPFNGRVGSRRAFAMATIPTAVIRRFKQRLGGSVDDVLLAVVAAGLSRQLVREDYPRLPPALRAMLPVSTRPPGDDSRSGNCVTAVFIDLPLGTTDLPALVRRIATSKSTLRSAHAASGSSLLIEAAARLPRPLHEAVVAARQHAAVCQSRVVGRSRLGRPSVRSWSPDPGVLSDDSSLARGRAFCGGCDHGRPGWHRNRGRPQPCCEARETCAGDRGSGQSVREVAAPAAITGQGVASPSPRRLTRPSITTPGSSPGRRARRARRRRWRCSTRLRGRRPARS